MSFFGLYVNMVNVEYDIGHTGGRLILEPHVSDTFLIYGRTVRVAPLQVGRDKIII